MQQHWRPWGLRGEEPARWGTASSLYCSSSPGNKTWLVVAHCLSLYPNSPWLPCVSLLLSCVRWIELVEVGLQGGRGWRSKFLWVHWFIFVMFTLLMFKRERERERVRECYACMCVCVCVCVCVCMHAYMHVCACVCMHACWHRSKCNCVCVLLVLEL